MYLQAPTPRPYPQGPLPPVTGPAAGDQLLMTAKRFVSPRHLLASRIPISLDRDGKDFGAGPNRVAVVCGSPGGLDYTIVVPLGAQAHQAHPHHQDQLPRLIRFPSAELGTIHFDQNRVGPNAGPRRISVCLPGVREDPGAEDAWPPPAPPSSSSLVAGGAAAAAEEVAAPVEAAAEAIRTETPTPPHDDEDEPRLVPYATAEHRAASKRESMVRALRSVRRAQEAMQRGRPPPPLPPALPDLSHFIFGVNEEPFFVPSLQAFSLDFSGRVTLPSNKNFLLRCYDVNPEGYTLVFGKVAVRGVAGATSDVYTLDFRWPLSPLQAFSIALASCDRKVLCA